MDRNFEARKFGSEHQAPFLAGWADADWYTGDGHEHSDPPRTQHTCITPRHPSGESRGYALPGDWLILRSDGTVRIEQGSDQDGYCTDCGEPVWWEGGLPYLVTRAGYRWCAGQDGARTTASHHHALPGMPQYVVRSPDGQVCHCLARESAHIHQIVLVAGPEPEPLHHQPAYTPTEAVPPVPPPVPPLPAETIPDPPATETMTRILP